MGLQQGQTYVFTVDSEQVARTMPDSKLVEVTDKSDIYDLVLTAIQKSPTVSISGSAFFEGEESTKMYKQLYKEKPLLQLTIQAKGSDSSSQKTI